MTIEYAFIIAEPNQVGSAALVGKFLHEATSIYHSFMVFDGPRQLYEADLLGLLEKTSARENAQCVVIAILSPFDVTPFPGEPAAAGSGAPSAQTAFLLGYLQGRLPKSHVFVVTDDSHGDFWIDPQIRLVSSSDSGWRGRLAKGLSEVGVQVDRAKVVDADG